MVTCVVMIELCVFMLGRNCGLAEVQAQHAQPHTACEIAVVLGIG